MAQFKTEGTSQTYGQLVIFPFKKDNSVPKLNTGTINAPEGIRVKLLPNNKTQLKIGDIDDNERALISMAAFSDLPDPYVGIGQNDQSIISDNTQETSEREKINISKMAENIEDYAIVVGSSYKTKQELRKITKDASAVDLFIMLKSLDSESVEFNNLKVTELNAKFTYNFYIPEESDISSQEDQSQDPFLKNDIFNIPRYVKLTWKPTKVTEEISSFELVSALEKLKPISTAVIGYSSYAFKDSYESSLKKVAPFVAEGKAQEIVDIHKLDLAFANTSNSTVFSNTFNVILGARPSTLSIKSIPLISPPVRQK
jgi:hypothetical protein